MLYIIDRFEGDIAVCEAPDGTYISVSRSQLPEGAAEGSCITLTDGAYELDEAETARRRLKAKSRLSKLFKNR